MISGGKRSDGFQVVPPSRLDRSNTLNGLAGKNFGLAPSSQGPPAIGSFGAHSLSLLTGSARVYAAWRIFTASASAVTCTFVFSAAKTPWCRPMNSSALRDIMKPELMDRIGVPIASRGVDHDGINPANLGTHRRSPLRDVLQ